MKTQEDTELTICHHVVFQNKMQCKFKAGLKDGSVFKVSAFLTILNERQQACLQFWGKPCVWSVIYGQDDKLRRKASGTF